MKTLKKTLCLVLALVMVVGTLAISASAADFTDQDKIEHEEAVALLVGLNVINGKDDGSYFDPEGILTRQEAAKILVYVINQKNAEKLSKVSEFTDVKDGNWAAGYINYVASQGIIVGDGTGKFLPESNLTVAAWAKMLLGALGYDPDVEGFQNTDMWAQNIENKALEVGLDAGIDDFNRDAEVSRDMACQMTLNALKATMVRYASTGTVVTTGDVTITTGASAASDVYAAGEGYDGKEDGKLQLIEKYFPNAKLTAGVEDDFARPAAYSWKVGKKTVYNAAEEATHTFTAAKAGNDLKDIAKAAGVKELKAAAGMNTYVNGVDTDAIAVGDDVEVYTNKDGEVTEIVAIHYDLAQITKISDLKKDEIKENDPSTKLIKATAAENGALEIRDAFFADFDYAEKDYVLVAVNGEKDAVLASKTAETVEGKVDALKGGKSRIGSDYYAVAAKTVNPVDGSIGQSGKWVLNAAGELAATVAAESTASSDYIYIYNLSEQRSTSTINEEGFGDSTEAVWTAYGLDKDGKKVSFELAVKDGKVVGDTEGVLTLTATSDGKYNKLVAYALDEDGKLTVAKASDTLKTVASATINTNSSKIDDKAYANASTVFYFLEAKNGAMTVKTVDGYAKANVKAEPIAYIANAKGSVTTVFVGGANDEGEVKSNAIYAVAVDATAVETGTGTTSDPTVFTYTVYVDGKETEIKSATKLEIKDGDLFTYETTNDKVTKVDVIALPTAATENVSFVNENQLVVDSKDYNIANAKVYSIVQRNGVRSVEDGTLAVGQTVYVATSKDASGTAAAVASYVFIVFDAE